VRQFAVAYEFRVQNVQFPVKDCRIAGNSKLETGNVEKQQQAAALQNLCPAKNYAALAETPTLPGILMARGIAYLIMNFAIHLGLPTIKSGA
jgi:hypothetical protein